MKEADLLVVITYRIEVIPRSNYCVNRSNIVQNNLLIFNRTSGSIATMFFWIGARVKSMYLSIVVYRNIPERKRIPIKILDPQSVPG